MRAQLVGAAYPRLAQSDLGATRPYPYAARDGMPIPAYLTLPPEREAKGLPLVVMPHGGPWGQDELTYDYWAQFLAERGYAVLQPNFRGSTGYGAEFEKAGEGQLGFAMQDDVTDGVRWADGSFERVDVILWATGFRPAIAHLAPLHLRSPLGGIQLDRAGRGTTAVADPRIQLVGYGPSASTIGANRAGRTAAKGVQRSLAARETVSVIA